MAAERPREADAVDPVHPEPVHQEPHPGVERRLRELDGPNVVLRHPQLDVAPVQDIGEGASVRHDPVAALLLCSVDRVDLSIINGHQVIRDGRLLTIDVEALIGRHNGIAQRLASKHVGAGRGL